jgi:hypothetical protein
MASTVALMLPEEVKPIPRLWGPVDCVWAAALQDAAGRVGLPDGELTMEPFQDPAFWGVNMLVFIYNGVKASVTAGTTTLKALTATNSPQIAGGDTAWGIEGITTFKVEDLTKRRDTMYGVTTYV